jgi:uncharacterized protein (DUF1778 family)
MRPPTTRTPNARRGAEDIRLSRAAREQFMKLLLNPPDLPPALQRAFERHRAMFEE